MSAPSGEAEEITGSHEGIIDTLLQMMGFPHHHFGGIHTHRDNSSEHFLPH
jgi:hypothetical protein